MKNLGIKTLYVALVIAIAGYVSTACGRLLNDPKPAPVDTRTVFQQKTDAKFESSYDCQYLKGESFYVSKPGIDGTATSTESAHCAATGQDPLDIYLLDRRTTSFSAFEQQLCAMSPPPTVICVGTGQDVGTVVDSIYANMN